MGLEGLGCTQEGGDVHVMAAGVGHRGLLPGVPVHLGDTRGGVVLAGLLRHGQGVDVAPHRHHRSFPVADDTHQAGLPDGDHLDTARLEFRADFRGGLVLLQGELGAAVEVLVQFLPGRSGLREIGHDLLNGHDGLQRLGISSVKDQDTPTRRGCAGWLYQGAGRDPGQGEMPLPAGVRGVGCAIISQTRIPLASRRSE